MSLRIDIQRDAAAWVPSRADIETWAALALGRRGRGELAVRVVESRESRRLNARFRGRRHPANVLSFPAARWPRSRDALAPLGDLVICPEVLRTEARAQHKSLRAHWAHLIVHGTLHLIGYDHRRAAQAQRMERREIAILKRLGFPNPYRSA
ncbi:MAG TPA: rRNA maturation RNase YbeY [Steroidobacteraceae bacterium]